MSLPVERQKRGLVLEYHENHLRPDAQAADDAGATNQRMRAERQHNRTESATDFDGDWETQVEELKQQLASKDMELKAVVAQKDAQIGLLKDMIQDAYSGRT